VVQQSTKAWAAALSKNGFVKFPWVPNHDAWLFDVSGRTPYLFPSPAAEVSERAVQVYDEPRDGFDGTATMLEVDGGYAGQVTLPTGSAIYASSGFGGG